jgi:hypothetical protein
MHAGDPTAPDILHSVVKRDVRMVGGVAPKVSVALHYVGAKVRSRDCVIDPDPDPAVVLIEVLERFLNLRALRCRIAV